MKDRMLTGCRGWLIILSASLAVAVVPFSLLSGATGSEMSPAPGQPMTMYKASPLSGCDDYHCLKCRSRDHCSTGARCDVDGCGHEHAVVKCHGCSVFYIRSHGGFKSCLARAEEAARVMNLAATLDTPEAWRYVVKEAAAGPEIWLKIAGMEQGRKVLSVTQADATGYRYRADLVPMSRPAEEIDRPLVAEWWAALLQDHFNAMVLGKRPTLTVGTHCGKPLLKAFDAARRSVVDGPIPMRVWREVFSRELSPTDRDRLGLVAQIIPKSFVPGQSSEIKRENAEPDRE